jgi:phosphoesterase RecJ-like protein
VIDHLRAVEGTAVAALIRERVSSENGGAGLPRKVSLRASDDRVDVSAIARVQGGGGHRQAAGFSTAMQWDELVEFLRREVAEQLGAGADGSAAVRAGETQ